MKIIIALGANLGDRSNSLQQATSLISQQIGKKLSLSSFYETPALRPSGEITQPQPDYLNAAGLFETSLWPHQVMCRLLEIEAALGRIRSTRWASRVIDLDFIVAESLIISSPLLTLPHPEMHKRKFVLDPLAEIAPNWIHPHSRKSFSQHLLELHSKIL